MTIVRHLSVYAFVSAVCVLLNLVILIGGDFLGVHYVLSTFISYVICVVIGYALHTRFSFRSQVSSSGFLRYAAAMGINVPSALVALWLLHDLFRIPMVVAAPVSTAVLALINYVLNRWAITGKMHLGIESR